jgi:hypothetical protein
MFAKINGKRYVVKTTFNEITIHEAGQLSRIIFSDKPTVVEIVDNARRVLSVLSGVELPIDESSLLTFYHKQFMSRVSNNITHVNWWVK